MDTVYKTSLRRQFLAAIDMLENAMKACPEALWSSRSQKHEFWYWASHTLFWLDFYLSDSTDDFAPPAPFGLEELDPAGKMPPRVYTKAELLGYLEHSRKKCIATIENMTDEKAHELIPHGKVDLTRLELLMYNMRHVQHHAAQLNMLLRQQIDSAPRWVSVGRE